MNILANSSVYLCGPVESDIANAYKWRESLASSLTIIEPTLRVWDPLVKPNWMSEGARTDQVAVTWKHHILDGDQHKAAQCLAANQEIRRICKQLAGKCDWMIARISKTFTWGSIDELEIAINRRIPIFLWMPDGLISIYGLSGCLHNGIRDIKTYTHTDMDHLVNTIANINNGNSDVLKTDPETWMFLTWKA